MNLCNSLYETSVVTINSAAVCFVKSMYLHSVLL